MITATALSSNWIWYFGRATGFVALILMTAIIVLGIAGRLRIVSERWPRFVVGTLHRDLALLSLLVLGIHIAAAVLDTYVKIPLAAAFVPFITKYQPFWVGMGALALDIMLAVIITSLLRRRVGLRVWKAIHWLNYAVWPMAVAHGIGIGSDSGTTLGIGLTMACVVIVAAAILARAFAAPVPATPLVSPVATAPAISRGGGAARTGSTSTSTTPRLRPADRVGATPTRVRPGERPVSSSSRVRQSERVR